MKTTVLAIGLLVLSALSTGWADGEGVEIVPPCSVCGCDDCCDCCDGGDCTCEGACDCCGGSCGCDETCTGGCCSAT